MSIDIIPEFSEIHDFHPIVHEWLTRHNIYHTHEMKIPDGRIDFYAIIDGKRTLIECKSDRVKTRDVAQLAAYCLDTGYKGVLAIPDYRKDDRIAALCRVFGIKLLLIEINPKVASINVVKRRYSELCYGYRFLLNQLHEDASQGSMDFGYDWETNKFRINTLRYFGILSKYHDATYAINVLASIVVSQYKDEGKTDDDFKWMEIDWFAMLHMWIIRDFIKSIR